MRASKRDFLRGSAAIAAALAARKAVAQEMRDAPEAYDPGADSRRSFAAMPTPRHGMGAAVVGDAIMSPAADR